MTQELLINIIKAILIPVIILSFIPVLIWWERKGAAYIQDRRGPNRASILGVRMGGLIHNIADVVKLLFKEDIIPAKAHKFIYILAPMLLMFIVVSVSAVIPFSAPIKIGDYVLKTQVADLNVGILYILAISSISVYGVLLAGWASSNSYSLFGGIRASAQMISYEVSMGLALVAVIIFSGTVRLDEMVSIQGTNVLNWNFINQPLAFILFLVCLFAEANRNPFDLPEGESELVAGYHTEYSSMKFALFFMAEYAHMVVGSLILVSIFFGGWQIPFLSTEALRNNLLPILKMTILVGSLFLVAGGILLTRRTRKFGWGDLRDFEPATFGIPMACAGTLAIVLVSAGVLSYLPQVSFNIIVGAIQMTVLLIKALFFCWFFIWVRWTLPRFRYDQLMKLGWQIMLPLALINIMVTALVIGRQ